jgi:hypothetical protein
MLTTTTTVALKVNFSVSSVGRIGGKSSLQGIEKKEKKKVWGGGGGRWGRHWGSKCYFSSGQRPCFGGTISDVLISSVRDYNPDVAMIFLFI